MPMTTPADKRVKKLEKALTRLTDSVMTFLRELDREMKTPLTFEQRGSRIAKLSNELELINDGVRYFELGVDYRKDKKP